MSLLQPILKHLHAIHSGTLDPDGYLLQWFSPELVNLFTNHAAQHRPSKTVFVCGRPLDCHKNALEFSMAHTGAVPWWGFKLLREGEGWGWWLHSWVIMKGTYFDSSRSMNAPLYVGIPWGWELYEAVRKKPGAHMKREELPPVLGRSIHPPLNEHLSISQKNLLAPSMPHENQASLSLLSVT